MLSMLFVTNDDCEFMNPGFFMAVTFLLNETGEEINLNIKLLDKRGG